jgi:hypothetical protein
MSYNFHALSLQGLVKFFFWLLVIALVLVMLTCLLVPIMIDHNLARTEARITTEGEKTDYLRLLPPSLPKKGNFFASQELQNIQLVDDENAKSKVYDEHRAPLLKLAEGIDKIPANLIADAGTHHHTDWSRVAEHLLESGFLTTPAPMGEEALIIRRTLEDRHPMLLKLSHQASVSTHAEFVPSFAKRPIPEMLMGSKMKHLECITNATRALKLHALACVDTGDAVSAIHDVQALTFMAAAFHREPSILTQLVSVTVLSQSLQIIWSIIGGHNLKLEDLRLLEAALKPLDQEAAMLESCRGELCIGLQLMDHLLKNPAARKDVLSQLAGNLTGLRGTTPEWFLKLNKAVLINLEIDGWLLPLKRGGLASGFKQADWLQGELEISSPNLLNTPKLFPMFLMPTTKVIFEMCIHAETQRRQALTSCALERYHLEHHRYPATLAELSPSPPIDPLSGQSFSYKFTPKVGYQIWAFGFDGKDDSGHVPLSLSNKPIKLSKANYQGDWVWRYEPVKQ